MAVQTQNNGFLVTKADLKVTFLNNSGLMDFFERIELEFRHDTKHAKVIHVKS